MSTKKPSLYDLIQSLTVDEVRRLTKDYPVPGSPAELYDMIADLRKTKGPADKPEPTEPKKDPLDELREITNRALFDRLKSFAEKLEKAIKAKAENDEANALHNQSAAETFASIEAEKVKAAPDQEDTVQQCMVLLASMRPNAELRHVTITAMFVTEDIDNDEPAELEVAVMVGGKK